MATKDLRDRHLRERQQHPLAVRLVQTNSTDAAERLKRAYELILSRSADSVALADRPGHASHADPQGSVTTVAGSGTRDGDIPVEREGEEYE